MTQLYARLSTHTSTQIAVDRAGNNGGTKWRFHLWSKHMARASAEERSWVPGLEIQTCPMLRDHISDTRAVQILLSLIP